MNVGEAYPNIGLGPDDEVSVTIVVEKDGDGFHAFTPGLKGLHVDGPTADKAVEAAKKAVEVYFESLNKHHETLQKSEWLKIHKAVPCHVRIQWHSIEQFGTRSKTPQLTG